MPKSSKLAPAIRVRVPVSIKDPVIVTRVLMGVLLVANVVMAILAFKPFGGSASDLRKDQAKLSAQLRQAQANVEQGKQHVAKIDIARTEGDDFLAKYVMQKRSAPLAIVDELNKDATDAGVRVLPDNFSYQEIEGSDTLQMVAVTAPFEGDYAGLAKLVNLLEKSPRFWIIDEMNLTAPQLQNNQKAAAGPQNLNVNLKLLAFVRDETGELQ